MDYRDFSDSQLVDLFKKESHIAFVEIYNRYWFKLYAAALIRLKDEEAAKEIIQDFFTGFWFNREKIVIRSSLEGYLFTSIKFLILNYKRALSVRNSYSDLISAITKDYDNSTVDSLNFRELKNTIEENMNKLPPQCRSVFQLSRMEYKNNKEIAKILGIKEKTVENHLTRALRLLKVTTHLLVIFFFKYLN
jgi:RNA polymerase sigma-70 factor (ECF subfamily)